MLPRARPGDFERLLWNYGEELEDLVVDMNFLRKRFQGEIVILEEEPLKLRPTKTYQILGIKGDSEVRVGYKCGCCEQIFLGAPKIDNEESIGPLSGRNGYDVRCRRCNTLLYNHTFMQS
jgi:hypothetical protein